MQCTAELQVDLTAARQVDLLLLARAQRGINPDCLGQRRPGPALGESKSGSIADIKPAGFPIAPLLWLDPVTQRRRRARERGEPMRSGLVNESGRQIVQQAALCDYAAAVFNGKLDFGLAVQGRSVGPGARNSELIGTRQA